MSTGSEAIRTTRHLFAMLGVIRRALADHRRLVRAGEPSRAEKAEWLHRCCADAMQRFEITLRVRGALPPRGLIVANHLSYLDILVLSAAMPCVFVSKAEVANWAVFGRFARMAGTVFVKREKKGNSAQANVSVAESLAEGVRVVLFPEGTTTDGSHLLRFHSSMMQPAIDAGELITPAAIAYEVNDGNVSTDLCFWGEMHFVPHMLKLLGKRGITAKILLGQTARPVGDRKVAASQLRGQVAELYCELHSAALLPTTGDPVEASTRK